MSICYLDTECYMAPSGHVTRSASSLLWLRPTLDPESLVSTREPVSLGLNVFGICSCSKHPFLPSAKALSCPYSSGCSKCLCGLFPPFISLLSVHLLKTDKNWQSTHISVGWTFFLNNALHSDSTVLLEKLLSSSSFTRWENGWVGKW